MNNTMLTFPRSGCTFALMNLPLFIPGTSWVLAHHLHHIEENSKVFGILRSPQESLTSLLSMLSFIGHERSGDVSGAVNAYKIIYEYYCNNDIFLIESSDLRKNPVSVFRSISKYLGLELNEDAVLTFPENKLDSDVKYLKSSLEAEEQYEYWYNFFQEFELSELERLYDIAKRKAVKVND